MVARIEAYNRWLGGSGAVPKLLLTFDASSTLMIGAEMADWCATDIANLEIEHCGAAAHLGQSSG